MKLLNYIGDRIENGCVLALAILGAINHIHKHYANAAALFAMSIWLMVFRLWLTANKERS